MNTPTYTPSMNAQSVILRTKDAIYVRIPSNLAVPMDFRCACDWCKENPDKPSAWDTLMIPAKRIKKYAHDFVTAVHMPDPEPMRQYAKQAGTFVS